MKKVYVASSLLNAEKVKEVIGFLNSRGIQVTYDWTKNGKIEPSEKELMKQVCDAEINGVIDADALLFISPARTGSHVELGIAITTLKPIFLHLDQKSEFKSFYLADNILYVDSDLNEVINKLIEHLASQETDDSFNFIDSRFID